MNAEFNDCLKNGRIKSFSPGKDLVQKELATGASDLEDAKDSLAQKKYKWATIQLYYAMFHCSRALLYDQNYRERSHYCLIIALRALYVDKKLLSGDLVERLQQAKTLRENADYYDDWSPETARALLAAAEEFLKASKKILKG